VQLLAWLIVPVLLLVAVPHELAHLFAARRFGVKVLEFGLGLPPRACSFEWRGTRWSINWLLPFGAFVKLKGEDQGSEADDFAALCPWQRAIVILAGPVANLVVAGVAIGLSLWLIDRPAGLQAVVVRDEPFVLGWVGVAQLMEELSNVGISAWSWFLALVASLSLGLGVANLLPVPPLDGARVGLALMELRVGRPVLSHRWAVRLNLMGLALLIVVFAVVTGADLVRLLSGGVLVAHGEHPLLH
jgi:membrane-associated protease RseP (regulator of RpoE activity)